MHIWDLFLFFFFLSFLSSLSFFFLFYLINSVRTQERGFDKHFPFAFLQSCQN